MTGAAKYNGDDHLPSLLHGHLVTSPHPHAIISAIDTSEALATPGVVSVLTGEDSHLLLGEVIEDRPPLARHRVRYHGEPVALVIGLDEASAERGALAVHVDYRPLQPVRSLQEALAPGAPLLHPELGAYRISQAPCFPEPGTNIADRAVIRKGDMVRGWREAEVIVEGDFHVPQVDHAAMETRSARVEILPDGRVVVHTATQAPFEVQKLLAKWFHLSPAQVIVNTPLIGGAFGGKAAILLEVLAYLASREVGGRPVRVALPREEDLKTAPVGPGLDAHLRLGAKADGRLTAAEMSFLLDTGAYTDSSPRMGRAITASCTGPYRINNVAADVAVVYTNHTYVTAWRGFGHMPMTFAIERMMDKLARALHMDPLELRALNLLAPGDTSPSRVRLTISNLGDPRACLERLKELMAWEEGLRTEREDGKVVAKGAALFWKTSTSDPNAPSAAVLALNTDGTVNLTTGAVEFGAGTKTAAAQILADTLRMDVGKIAVRMHVNTETDPIHWKTVASLSTLMVGRAVQAAAQDVLAQLKEVASIILRCPPEDLAVEDGRVYLRADPDSYILWKDIAQGYSYRDGPAVGGPIVGKGAFIMRHITPLDRWTGEGRSGPMWTTGAQGVEVELDVRRSTYRILRAYSVIDAGRLVNPKGARGLTMGGMAQGLSVATREAVSYGPDGVFQNDQLRLYKTMRIGEEPASYVVDFVESGAVDSPFGLRPLGEHGVLAIPAAFANALSLAKGSDFDALPITPEAVWRS